MLIGYARVSTDDQNLDLQRDALARVGCDKIFTDKASGARDDREGLIKALSHLRKGDTLVVWKLDRLGRTTKGLISLVDDLRDKGVDFRSVTDGIDTSTVAGRFFFNVMASLAQMERELNQERTQAGLAAARARGRTGGRKPKITPEQLGHAKHLLKDPNATVTAVAATLRVDRSTLYRAMRAAAKAA